MKKISYPTKTATNHLERAFDSTILSNYKYIATRILASALEDADIEFLENDYSKWKELRKKTKEGMRMNELEFLREFKEKERYKENLFDMAELTVNICDIPSQIMAERNVFERNNERKLKKIFGDKFNECLASGKKHGWKLGKYYVEPTIFDL